MKHSVNISYAYSKPAIKTHRCGFNHNYSLQFTCSEPETFPSVPFLSKYIFAAVPSASKLMVSSSNTHQPPEPVGKFSVSSLYFARIKTSMVRYYLCQ